ncbi:MAG: metallophosphoesterase [Candidatus Pseudobacter hemicellulosilyticus]|uniref:Metallophosphoesterase n=1 Tax=Candidatus Pseudobacter hemicellulosilyticus TaxID=3121375 RepID=A0AAJ5WXC4_9BACT|nr:MAG: metallophosphoesterase [Pseudobacter sp.]
MRIGLILFLFALSGLPGSAQDFSFVFMTDIHVKPEAGAAKGFRKAIDTANTLPADFVLMGGDLVFDVMRGNRGRGDTLFRLYKETARHFRQRVYPCIGNHELFGIYAESGLDSTDPDYKYGMYERYLGPTWYSFDHKGWHFIVLNSIDAKDYKYYGVIGPEQMAWLKKDLAALPAGMPIVLVTHIPLVSAFQQLNPPKTAPADVNGLWVSNRNEVLALFDTLNLKLVLQGHLHWLEDLYLNNKTHFITGGAIAGRPSWRGTRHEEEGFLHIKIVKGEVKWDYIDYGWEVMPE